MRNMLTTGLHGGAEYFGMNGSFMLRFMLYLNQLKNQLIARVGAEARGLAAPTQLCLRMAGMP